MYIVNIHLRGRTINNGQTRTRFSAPTIRRGAEYCYEHVY